MEFASLEDAFPDSGQMTKRKRSKRNQEGFQADSLPPTDADRPAVTRMPEVAPLNQGGNTLDTLLDESSKFLKKPTVMNSIPPPRSTIRLEKDSDMPSYFGAEAFTNPTDENHASFSTSPGGKNEYMLESDFTKSFEQPGLERASGVTLPVPELRHRWKTLSSDRVESSYTTSTKPSQFSGMDTGDIEAMRSKIDKLMARLDDLENRAAGANPQLEMMSFIMTGIFLMFVVDLAVRKSGNMRLVNVR
jgi:hypothetical protein